MSWSEQELRKIKAEYQDKTDEELAEELGKTYWQVLEKRRDLGLKKIDPKWTDKEITLIEEGYEEKTDKELAEELGKTYWQVLEKRHDLGLKKSQRISETGWTDGEIEWLRENYDRMSDKDLASELGKSTYQVQQKRYDLGLKKDPKKGGNYDPEGITAISQSGKKTKINHSIGSGRKSHLKGKLGEALADSLKTRISDFIEAVLDDRWEFFGWEMKVLNPRYEITTVGVGNERETKAVPRSGPPKIYSTPNEHDVHAHAQHRYVLADEELLKQFNRVYPPTVDKTYYAVEYSGDSWEIEFEVQDLSTGDAGQIEHVEIELPVISDFRILAVEVKTTTTNVRKSLTEAQSGALDTAKQSEKLQFYTMQIAIDNQDFSIPDQAEIQIERLG